MSDNSFSSHAPTGQTATNVVSPNPYAQAGRNIGYPTYFDLYPTKISSIDGNRAVTERRTVADLVGNRLYLYHRPVTNADGTSTTINSTDGTIDTSSTNNKQGYIVFSSLPTSDFTVTYTAAPDCVDMWHLNTIQDSVMEVQQVLGPTNQTGYAGLRNLAYGLFDRPDNATASGVAQRAVFLSHLGQDIYIGSSADAGLAATRGDAHTIQIGRETDKVVIDATGFTIQQNDGTLNTQMNLGGNTGDFINWVGKASGAGPVAIGGPEWSNYSGVTFAGSLTGPFYTGSMLQVHGDVSVMGNIKSIGSIEIITTTGVTSTVYGDWTIRDELFVLGTSYLRGNTYTNRLDVTTDLHISGDLIAGNRRGSGGNGQTLIDNLDPSEIAHSYQYVTKSRIPNTVICGPRLQTALSPKNTIERPWFTLDSSQLAGDLFAITGALNAAVGPSGAHPAIFQLLLSGVAIVSGTYKDFGSWDGIWSPGMMDPGSLRIRMLNGQASGYDAPVYAHKVEETGANGVHLLRMNVFTPEIPDPIAQTNDKYMLYAEHATPYNFISAAGGAAPTFSVNASAIEPFAVSFDDTVRIMTQSTASSSLTNVLTNSVSGLGPADAITGIAYIFAKATNTDPEAPPQFVARSTMYRMPNEVGVGEIVAYYSGAQWVIRDTISYRPQGIYDSAWIPMIPDTNVIEPTGRATSGFTSASSAPMKLYFNHHLGTDIDAYRLSADLYLGSPSINTGEWNRTHSPMWSMLGQDERGPHGLTGAFVHVPLGAKRVSSHITDRDASIFYLDSSIVGIDISPELLDGFPTGGGSTEEHTYLRLVMRRDS